MKEPINEPCVTCKLRNKCSREFEGQACDSWEFDAKQYLKVYLKNKSGGNCPDDMRGLSP